MSRAERNAEIVRRAERGELYREIAADVGLTPSHVSYIARKAGIVRSSAASGSDHPNWKGGRAVSAGYVFLRMPDHPRANPNGYVREHIVIAERVLGKPLPKGAQVHHVNGDGTDNRNCNLMICQDEAYHRLLHVRENALEACGRADWIHCSYCDEWGPEEEFYLVPERRYGYHPGCERRAQRERRRKEAASCA